MNKFVNIHSYKINTLSEGPGKRFAIWFQGCLKRCKGCCNQEILAVKKMNIISINDICSLILKSKNENNIEGVTFLGGEPILQIYGLIDIVKFCKKINLTSIVFSGYYKEEIQKMFPKESIELFNNIDILIDGPFEIENLETNRAYIGSKNQRTHFFTDKYDNSIFKNKNSLEIVSNLEYLIINGYPVNSNKKENNNGK